ncbi:MAG: hypothetical protein JWO75_481 [Actinomycetia bacterium]|nr:hypothetical protein [Actinomycetes bacterium]
MRPRGCGTLGGMNRWARFEMMLRHFAHRRGWLWSPSQGWSGVPFGRHGVRLLPVNKGHAAMVLHSHEVHNASMARILDDLHGAEREQS